MKNIKKIILFLGAIALIGWGNYVKQKSKIVEVTTNNPSGNINSLGNSTTIENKLPESSTSSKGKDENKNFIKKENKRVQKEVKQNNEKIEQKTKERATSSKNENQNKNPENKNNLEIQKENKDSGKASNEEKKTNPIEVKSSEGTASNKN